MRVGVSVRSGRAGVVLSVAMLVLAGGANGTRAQQLTEGPGSSVTPGSPVQPESVTGGVDQAALDQSGFVRRLFKAYADDWKERPSGGPDPAFRGYPAPVTNPPYPFSVWPYGGSPVLGQPDTNLPPLMQAIDSGPGGKAWEKSRVKIYGWVNYGANLSTSSQKNGLYANLPAAYSEIPNTVQLDQATLYVERVPDSVQTDHFDWGFRLTNLYGLDYRFTTAKGYFSSQLLKDNAPLGNKYGYDPVMFYVDLYFPHVAEGMNVRIGRYISLPDIEAQLAPNNYTYSHSLTYTYDCYTQTGINATVKIGQHWMVQGGVSPGCEAAPWIADAKLTGSFCVGYTWNNGGDNFYNCANAINDGTYAYNNVNAYYTTWYHKFDDKWHMAWETWYQFEKHVPNVNPAADPAVLAAAAPLLQTNANGAWCGGASLTCYAPNWATVHYLNRQFTKTDYLSIRNEYFNDIKGQRTGFQSKYTEHAVSWNHWIGSTLLFRPEIRYERAYDQPAYNGGTRKNQFMLAGDVLLFY
jgi:hypothetical protein